MHCSRCNINWASLHSQECGDDEVEFCPLCKSDMFLEPSRQSVDTYVRNPITGLIRNTLTKQPYIATIDRPVVIRTHKETVSREQRKQEEEDRILAAIDIYQSTYQTHGKEAALAAYFEACKKPSK